MTSPLCNAHEHAICSVYCGTGCHAWVMPWSKAETVPPQYHCQGDYCLHHGKLVPNTLTGPSTERDVPAFAVSMQAISHLSTDVLMHDMAYKHIVIGSHCMSVQPVWMADKRTRSNCDEVDECRCSTMLLPQHLHAKRSKLAMPDAIKCGSLPATTFNAALCSKLHQQRIFSQLHTQPRSARA